jgi:hypothetical protein
MPARTTSATRYCGNAQKSYDLDYLHIVAPQRAPW